MPDLTAEMIVDQSRPEELDLSPDGQYVAYATAPLSKREEHPTATLWVAPTAGSSVPRQFTTGTANDHAPRWSPDGSAIAFLSDRANRGTDALYLIAASGGEAQPLTSTTNKKSIESFAWSPDGAYIAFTAADEPDAEAARREKERDDADVYGAHWPFARLRLISPTDGTIVTLAGGDRHIDGFAWAPSGAEIAFTTRRTPALESREEETTIERLVLSDDQAKLVCRFGYAVQSLCWTGDGQTLLFEAPMAQRAQSSTVVYAVAASGGEPRRLALGESSCSSGLVQPFTVGGSGAYALVAEARGLETRLGRLDPSTGQARPLSLRIAETDQLGIANWTARASAGDAMVVAAVLSTGGAPAELWAGRSSDAGPAGPLIRLSNHNGALHEIRFGSQEPFLYEGPDGLALDGLLVRPPDAPSGRPLPLIVQVHGGPYWRSGHGFYLGWSLWAQWLALAGYAVLMPNYRGGQGHGERFAATARGNVGPGDFPDVMAAVDAAVARGIADTERLAIGGWSQGGFMSAWAVTQTHRFKAAIMGAGVSDWGMMTLTSDLPGFEMALGGSAPWDGAGPHRHAALSPISFAAAVQTPVLILHGEKDERVPLSQAIGFHRALRRHNVPTELVVYPREPHGIGERAHQIDLLGRVRAWYDRWLSPPTPPTP
jgi:dipeptidyl aminopeptidase/acylaminoacyl peptidase